ncbi:shikimate dehydrogenase [Actinomycetospora sp.]|uniref:shikimate dehydrogenase n=1 Tax=Actinomycetospora sp. TaxID=1872135 RepID=UPI002F3EEB53
MRDEHTDSPVVVRAGLIGAGIGPSLSPALHEREARELGVDCHYSLVDLDVLGRPADDVGDLLDEARRAGFAGVNITHPCKRLVLDHVAELSDDAAAIGAVNTVVFRDGRSIGHNTDWSGFRSGLLDGLPGASLERVALVGAGGAGAAAAHALLTLGAGTVTVLDVDAAQADRLATALVARFGPGRAVAGAAGEGDVVAAALSAAGGLVHATPVGMTGHPGLPVHAELLRADLWVAEIVYRPLETDLLRAARRAGCPTLDGGRMAVHQAAEALRLFTGRAPDPERMLRHLRRLIGAGPEERHVA